MTQAIDPVDVSEDVIASSRWAIEALANQATEAIGSVHTAIVLLTVARELLAKDPVLQRWADRADAIAEAGKP
jgi:hypothetical protein